MTSFLVQQMTAEQMRSLNERLRTSRCSDAGCMEVVAQTLEFWMMLAHCCRIAEVPVQTEAGTQTWRMSISAPRGYMISLTTLQLPPAPWSWICCRGLLGPSSTQALTTRHSLLAISASPLCNVSLHQRRMSRVFEGVRQDRHGQRHVSNKFNSTVVAGEPLQAFDAHNSRVYTSRFT